MSFSKLMASLLLLASISLSTSLVSDPEALTAYDILQQYGFPVGILPIGATGYQLNRATGEFSLYLSQKCKFKIDSYELEYKSTLQGVISKGRIRKLKGVSVKIFLLWLSIVEVVNDGDDLQFSVGIASANFPLDSFYESPRCGCGFDCDNGAGSLVSAS
ncbi:uncharacterized protein LOC101206914 [Cucumis sativus]|uniref:uncharacterized protein LOC101206914 n=1 Tax=Cucumis sativus TaxID=3659 RepID=UPI0002B42368|nr:uncharacterized protein LOC101206914 [Cucumis sativus]KGN45500.2 hypothetical protein Csa_016049 [Cucumis sativus]